jgi:hypothetical protein
MNTTRRYPRTLEEAFGPYQRGTIHEPYPEMHKHDRIVVWASAVALVSLVGIALFSSSAHAQEDPAPKPTEAQRKATRCTHYGSIAKSIMSMRQMGMAMSTLMTSPAAADSKPIQAIIMLAYDEPRYQSEQIKNEVIQDFRNKIEAECFK